MERNILKSYEINKNPRKISGDDDRQEREVQDITREKQRNAYGLYKLNNGKAVGPDGIPVEVWKCLGREGIDIF